MNTLGARSTLSDSAIQFLIDALKDDDAYFRSSAALSLSKQSTLSESALMSIFAVLNNEDGSPAPSVVCSQFSLSESEIQTFIDKLKNVQNEEDESVREALRQCEITIFFEQFELSNLASQSLTDALEDEDEDAVKAAVLELRSLSTLKHSVMTSLIDIIVEEDPDWYEDSFGDADEHAFWYQEQGAALIEDYKWEEEEYEFRNHRASAARVLGNKTSLSESATRSFIAALKDEERRVRYTASWVLQSQTSLSESAIHLLIAALKDEGYVKSSAARALDKQSTLPESVIHSVIAALKDDNDDVRIMAANALGKQPALTEPAIQSLIATLNDDDGAVRSSAADALGKQPALTESAIQSLIATLKDDDKDVRYSVSEVLYRHCLSLCIAYPRLTENEMVCVYKNHLFPYSCQHILSLQVRDRQLCWHTERDPIQTGPMQSDVEELINSTFAAVQREAGLL